MGVIETFAALSEPNRYRIVELLRSGPRAVNDIGDRLHLNQPQVSKHLRVLKEAGLVDVQPRAQQRLYELRARPLRQLHDWLERYRRIWEERFDELDQLILAALTAHGMNFQDKTREFKSIDQLNSSGEKLIKELEAEVQKRLWDSAAPGGA